MRKLFIITMATLLLGLLSMPCLPSFAQSSTSTTEIVYKAPALSLKILDNDNKELTYINIGKDVYIFVDTFFRSYQVFFKDADGELKSMKYKFLKVDDPKTNRLKVQDNNDEYHYLTDFLEVGTLFVIPAKARPDGMIGVFIVKNAERTRLDHYDQ